MTTSSPVVVVGGGIAGCAVAIELATRGAAVTLIEKNQPGVGATGASAGMLAPQYEAHAPDAAFHFGVACKAAYPAFVERLQRLAAWKVGLRTDGMLVANYTSEEERTARRDLAFQKAVGLEGEVLTVTEARQIHPDVSTDVHSWLWLPAETQVDSQRLAVVLADAVQSAGARLVRSAQVTALTSRHGRVDGVRLAKGREIGAEKVVLAAGAWSAEIEGMPRRLPIRPVRGQILRLLPSAPIPWALVCSHDGRYLVPRDNGTVLVGSTMEDVGFDDRVTHEGREFLAEAAASLLPCLGEARIVEAWAGLRPISGDSWPILGPDPEMEGLFYAAGHGRNGILFAPLVGRAVAELTLEGKTEVPWEDFRIERFTDRTDGSPAPPPAGTRRTESSL